MKKMMITMTALAAGLVMLFPASASAAATRTVEVPFEFYALGHGDLGGFCLNSPTAPVPPEAGAFQSCAAVAPVAGEDHVGVTAVDSTGNAVYISIQQDNNPGFAWGCGTLQGGDLSADGLFPINGSGPGGTAADDVLVFPWAGAGINNVLDPGGSACIGSADSNVVHPGTTGKVTFTFYDNVA